MGARATARGAQTTDPANAASAEVAAAAAAAARPTPVNLPIIIGQHVIQPDGTLAGAFESSSSSSGDDGSSSTSEGSEEVLARPRRPSQDCCDDTQEVLAAARAECASAHASDTAGSCSGSDCGGSDCCGAAVTCSSSHICVDIADVDLQKESAARSGDPSDCAQSDELPFGASRLDAAAVAEESDAACAC